MLQESLTNDELIARRNAAIPRGPFNVAPIFAARAQGSHIWDADGRRYLDFCGGIGVLNVGHNHPRVVEAIRKQLEQVIHTCWHVAMYEPYLALAERLNELVPVDGPNKACFFNSGAEAVENAIKVSRAATGRQAAVAFERGYHGRTLLTLTLTGKVQPYCAGFGPFAPEVYRLPYQPFFGGAKRSDAQVEKECRAALDRLLAYHINPEAVACVLMEPVLGEGGFLPAHPAAVRLLREFTALHGIVMVADEVQSGFGRCGSLFASERYELRPDVMVVAKSLGGGMPLSGIVGRAALLDAPQVGGLGGTYGGNPLACAAANAVLDVMEEEGLPERAREIGERVMARFDELEGDCDAVAEARGLGAMCGLEIVDPADRKADAARAGRIAARCRENGLLVMTASGNVIRTLMPLTIDFDDLRQGLDVLADAVRGEGA
jgi:4-aminobutyrate aminotransferase/(S)-3-amino-2-methylpropionate transaminase